MSLLPLFLLFSQGQTPPSSAQPIADLQRRIQMIESQLKSGETWTTAKGKYVLFDYVPDRSVTDELVKGRVAACDKAVEQDCKILNIDLPTNPIEIYFYPGTAELGKALKLPGPVTGGMSLGNWAAFPDPHSPRDLYGTACYQIGHALVHENWGLYGCQVFSEGLSTYLQAAAEKQAWLTNPKPIEEEPMKDLAQDAKFPPDFKQAAAFIAYLLSVDKGNPARLQAAYSGMNTARIRQLQGVGKETWPQRVEKVFADVYGKDLDHLEADWRQAALYQS